MPYLRYHYYDFHEECKNNKFENSEALVEQLKDVIDIMGYNCIQIRTGTLLQEQKGVFRTNCLDCLDRTNYVQSRIARKVCKMFMERYSSEIINSMVRDKELLDLPVN